ncbi:Gfo/Idh/MocA family protein [Ureibacillus sinduriensis]|uniref:Oxidoreductase n=1 Tax=Ureibacillus sinduriensis BLB-1 = JCM 15800 TaxID=1384057 RepID=A0A0A3HSN7_9BACL|nr:Gfo/Idh/MocA family oxidoreductase [Ureibacillus sinduriensis]KGR74230.1 oxidoreductase [Ureibacillus sinduriensis BLB-1 = JCM 15800]
MDTVKWGILSTADIAQTQLIPAIGRASNAEVIAIASRGPKVHEVAKIHHIKRAYETYEELLQDKDIQVIYIPLPNDMHKEWVVKAALAGKHILCEKPIALSEEDLEEMLTVCIENNVYLMEAFMYQFHPQHRRVKEIIEAGEIGEVKLYKSSHSFDFTNREGNIRMDASKGGGALWDVGCYSVHAMNLILNLEPKKVTFSAITDPKAQVDVSAFGTVQLEQNIYGLIDCSFDMTDRNEYEIIGTKGTIKVKYAFRPDHVSGNGQIIITNKLLERKEQVSGDIYKLEVEFFSNIVAKGGSLEEHHKHSKRNVKVLLAAQASLKENREIEINGDNL